MSDPAHIDTPSTQPAPAAGVSPEQLALATENARLKAEQTARSKAEADAAAAAAAARSETASTEMAARLAALEAERTEARALAERAIETAKGALKQRYLTGLRKDSYAGLAPDVQLGEDGQLTAESVAALEKFRADNVDLFDRHRGTTPTSAASASSDPLVSVEDQRILASLAGPRKAAGDAVAHPYAHMIGHGAKVSHRGVGV